MFPPTWESQNVRTNCKKCRNLMTWKDPGHLSSQTEFLRDIGTAIQTLQNRDEWDPYSLRQHIHCFCFALLSGVSVTFALFQVLAAAPSSGPQLTGHMTCCSATTQFNVMCSAVGHFVLLQVFSALSVSLRCGVASPGHWCRTFRHNVVVPPEGRYVHEIHRCDSQKQIPLLCLFF
jgi:AraC-like DNA-binding protein